MNGREVLACWEAVEPEMTIEPLRNLPVIRDLVVDRTPYESKVASLEPWLERRTPMPDSPSRSSHKQMKDASKALDCIGCMCCYSACPVIGLGDLTDFAGPAPLVQLGQTALDPRNDPAKVARSLALTGIFNCVSCYKCEEVCPAAIPIVSRIIEPLKAKAALLFPACEAHARACANRGSARPRRSRRFGASRAGFARACQTSAHHPPAAARQDQSAANIVQYQDAGRGSRSPVAWSRGLAMKFAYYPGCSARSTCAELNEATHRVAHRLGLDLLQLESATCTGARELRAIDPAGFYTLNVRILALAEREELPLMTICNTCTLNVLDAHAAFVSDKELGHAVNDRLAEEGLQYSGRTRISHFLWVLHEDIGEDRLARTRHQSLDRSDGGGILRMPHYSSAVAIRLRRLAQ